MTDSQPHKLRKCNQSDEELISYFKSEAMKKPHNAYYVSRLVSELTQFIYWCFSTGRPPIAGRLNQLDDDVKSYTDKMRLDKIYSASILNRALNKLRNPKLFGGGFIEAEVAEDEELIREVRTGSDINLVSKTKVQYAAELRRFSNWLYENKKPPMADRLFSPGLREDLNEFARGRRYKTRILPAFGRLLNIGRKRGAKNSDVSGSAPYPEDAELIEAAAEAVMADNAGGGGKSSVMSGQTLRREVKRLKEFGAWLRRTGRRPIVGRLPSVSLKKDKVAFYRARPPAKTVKGSMSGGIKMLLEYEKEIADFALDLERQLESNEIRPAAAAGTSQQRARQALFEEIFGESPPETRQPSPQASVVGSDVDKAISPMMRDDAFGVSILAGLPPLELDHGRHSVPPLMAEPEADFGAYVPLGWSGGLAPQPLIAKLDTMNLLPMLFQPRGALIHGRRYTAVLRPGKELVTPYNPRGHQIDLAPGAWPLGLQIPSPVGTTASNPLGGNVTHDEGYADRRIRHRPDRTRGQDSGSRIRSEYPLVLAPEQWLGDEHIIADYALVREQLQRDDPDLAARTRFVSPSQAFLLRVTEEMSVRQEIIQRIVQDEDRIDTTDFLFLPVNNAEADREGSHWSLLFVDRRERENPVAYHYDSARPLNSNVAEQLAERLGGSMRSARLAQQRNDFDCGVFVVDATRTLVARLTQGERPEHEPLHLDHLSADRPELQRRLWQNQVHAEMTPIL